MAVSIPEGQKLITDAVKAVGTERVPLKAAFGRVLAENITAREDVPAFDRSPYDGYALRSEDVKCASADMPVVLKVVDNIPAGSVSACPLKSGEAARLMTGAPIPDGADAVVMYEDTEFTDETVSIFRPVRHGENIIYAGEDVKAGALLAEAGIKIDSGLMGTLAGQNIAEPLVYKQLNIGIIITGSELVPLGTEPGEGCIIDTNRYTLTGAMERYGFACTSYGIVTDDLEAITSVISAAADECDAVLITGGAASGDFDLTPAAMKQAGVDILFRGLRLKPGKACTYGVKDGKLICGLSGHPSSSILNLLVAGLPGLRKMSGLSEYMHKEFEMELEGGFNKKSDMARALRGRFFVKDGIAKIKVSEAQGNVMISGTIGTDCIVIIPEGSPAVPSGTKLNGFMI